jgi:RNA polymerase sigma-70 factor (ECF subfamily)
VTEERTEGLSPKKNAQTPSISGEELGDLVSRAKKGHVGAFQELYGFYSRKILNYTYRLTGSREEAEDLTQETFVLAYKNLTSLKEHGKFQSWLFRIAQNNVYQKYRGTRPQFDSLDEIEAPESSAVQKLITPHRSPEERLLSDELEQVIQKVISQLPDKHKRVFILSAIQKLSYKEISEIVGRSLASVKSDIHRARVGVREKIRQYLREDHEMSDLH